MLPRPVHHDLVRALPGADGHRPVRLLAAQLVSGHQQPAVRQPPVICHHGLKYPAWGIGTGIRSAAYQCLGGPVRISDILRVKGTRVVTVTPDTKVRQLLAVLAEHRIGAVVVSHDGTTVDGIASERDIVQALARRGAAVMSEPVTAIYTAEVHTVTPQTPIEEVMRMMTERRVRHAPVVADGSLQGIVSIGDVVKIRLGELETERTALTDYITGTR
jgi:CBS domain-containing protein